MRRIISCATVRSAAAATVTTLVNSTNPKMLTTTAATGGAAAAAAVGSGQGQRDEGGVSKKRMTKRGAEWGHVSATTGFETQRRSGDDGGVKASSSSNNDDEPLFRKLLRLKATNPPFIAVGGGGSDGSRKSSSNSSSSRRPIEVVLVGSERERNREMAKKLLERSIGVDTFDGSLFKSIAAVAATTPTSAQTASTEDHHHHNEMEEESPLMKSLILKSVTPFLESTSNAVAVADLLTAYELVEDVRQDVFDVVLSSLVAAAAAAHRGVQASFLWGLSITLCTRMMDQRITAGLTAETRLKVLEQLHMAVDSQIAFIKREVAAVVGGSRQASHEGMKVMDALFSLVRAVPYLNHSSSRSRNVLVYPVEVGAQIVELIERCVVSNASDGREQRSAAAVTSEQHQQQQVQLAPFQPSQYVSVLRLLQSASRVTPCHPKLLGMLQAILDQWDLRYIEVISRVADALTIMHRHDGIPAAIYVPVLTSLLKQTARSTFFPKTRKIAAWNLGMVLQTVNSLRSAIYQHECRGTVRTRTTRGGGGGDAEKEEEEEHHHRKEEREALDVWMCRTSSRVTHSVVQITEDFLQGAATPSEKRLVVDIVNLNFQVEHLVGVSHLKPWLCKMFALPSSSSSSASSSSSSSSAAAAFLSFQPNCDKGEARAISLALGMLGRALLLDTAEEGLPPRATTVMSAGLSRLTGEAVDVARGVQILLSKVRWPWYAPTVPHLCSAALRLHCTNFLTSAPTTRKVANSEGQNEKEGLEIFLSKALCFAAEIFVAPPATDSNSNNNANTTAMSPHAICLLCALDPTGPWWPWDDDTVDIKNSVTIASLSSRHLCDVFNILVLRSSTAATTDATTAATSRRQRMLDAIERRLVAELVNDAAPGQFHSDDLSMLKVSVCHLPQDETGRQASSSSVKDAVGRYLERCCVRPPRWSYDIFSLCHHLNDDQQRTQCVSKALEAARRLSRFPASFVECSTQLVHVFGRLQVHPSSSSSSSSSSDNVAQFVCDGGLDLLDPALFQGLMHACWYATRISMVLCVREEEGHHHHSAAERRWMSPSWIQKFKASLEDVYRVKRLASLVKVLSNCHTMVMDHQRYSSGAMMMEHREMEGRRMTVSFGAAVFGSLEAYREILETIVSAIACATDATDDASQTLPTTLMLVRQVVTLQQDLVCSPSTALVLEPQHALFGALQRVVRVAAAAERLDNPDGSAGDAAASSDANSSELAAIVSLVEDQMLERRKCKSRWSNGGGVVGAGGGVGATGGEDVDDLGM